MARFVMHDSEPRFTVVRGDDEDGRVEFRINSKEGTVVLDVGPNFTDVEELASALENVAKELRDDILQNWQDRPSDYDCYVTLDRGGYYVQVEQKEAPANPYPTREIAYYEAARLMSEQGCFPNAWISGEHGPASEPCDDEIRAYHDEGGDKVKPLPGVQYADGQEVLHDGDEVEIVRDYGDLGIVFWIYGDRSHFERDRSKFAPKPDES